VFSLFLFLNRKRALKLTQKKNFSIKFLSYLIFFILGGTYNDIKINDCYMTSSEKILKKAFSENK